MAAGDRAAVHRRGALAAAVMMMGGCSVSSPAPAARRGARPSRIVSLNPCLDVILVRVADRSQIAALSHYARDPYGSTIADLARSLPFTYETTEEVIAIRPDLVLASEYGAPAMKTALTRLGVAVAAFGVPETVADSLAQVREVALVAGHPERGEALVGRIEAALVAFAGDAGRRRPSALVFMPGGFASGPGTLMDEMMRRAGLENAAARYGLTGSQSVSLERLVADPPDVLLAGEPYPGAPSWAERTMEHPALTHLAGRMRRAIFPERLLFCGGPVLMQTARALAGARNLALQGSV